MALEDNVVPDVGASSHSEELDPASALRVVSISEEQNLLLLQLMQQIGGTVSIVDPESRRVVGYLMTYPDKCQLEYGKTDPLTHALLGGEEGYQQAEGAYFGRLAELRGGEESPPDDFLTAD